MHALFKPDLIGVKLFSLGNTVLHACAAAGGVLFPMPYSSGSGRRRPTAYPRRHRSMVMLEPGGGTWACRR